MVRTLVALYVIRTATKIISTDPDSKFFRTLVIQHALQKSIEHAEDFLDLFRLGLRHKH